jgi:hypothetical protein
MRSPQPSVALLVTFSESSLEGFELARLDEIARLRREMQDVHDEWVEAEVAARLARLLLESRRIHRSTDLESLALLDPRTSAKTLPAPPPALQGLHARTNPTSLLDGRARKPHANRALPLGESIASLAFESVAASGPAAAQAVGAQTPASAQVPADGSRPAIAAAPALSQPADSSHGNAARNRNRPALASAKIRSTAPLRSAASPQLPLFDQTHPNPQQPEASLLQPEASRVQPAAQLPTRAVLCLIRRPRVEGRRIFSLFHFSAAS